MAVFQPRFVDLVRNYTTTSGTADFVLGATVNGYSSFGSALQPGDQFYYSAIGIDKPIEREVGRGTLNADGTIARDPVSGIKTNFSNGIKSLSLIAAAEWFNNVQAGAASGGAGGGPTIAATRTAVAAVAQTQLPLLLTEPGREGLFVFDSANLAAKVQRDTYQAVYVAPASDPTGASGAWVRNYHGPIHAEWAGFADGAANNAARLESLIGLADPARGDWILLPYGTIAMDRRVVLTLPARIEGRNMGSYQGSTPNGGTALQFPAGSTGFRVKHGAPGASANYAQIANLNIVQAGATGTTGLAGYNPSAPTTINVTSGAANFSDGQIVWLEGAGPAIQVLDRMAAVSAGSNSVTITTTCPEFIGNPGVYVGQQIDIAGAGLPVGTYVTGWTTNTITLSANATATVSGSPYTIYCPLVAEIQSGGGTATLTIDNPSPCSSGAPTRAVTGAVLRHAPAAIYSTVKISCRDVHFGYFSEGLGALLRGSTSDGSLADNGTFDNCYFNGKKAGLVLTGSDASANTFLGCNFAGPEVGVFDMGFLGNYFFGCHWAFNVGIVVSYSGALTNLVSCYLEQGTSYIAPSGAKCGFFNTTSMFPRSGWGGVFFGSGTLFTGPVQGSNGAFGGALVCGNNAVGQTSFYAAGSISGPPYDAAGAGVQIGSGGAGNANYILSCQAAGSGVYQRLCIAGSDIYFGTSAGGTELAKLSPGGVDLPGTVRAYSINGSQVVGPRITGWTAAAGTASRGAFAAAAAGTASATYTASELQSALNRIAALEARVVAYDTDLRAHGLIGS